MQTDSVFSLKAIPPKSDQAVKARTEEAAQSKAVSFSSIFAMISRPSEGAKLVEDQSESAVADDSESPDIEAETEHPTALLDETQLKVADSASETEPSLQITGRHPTTRPHDGEDSISSNAAREAVIETHRSPQGDPDGDAALDMPSDQKIESKTFVHVDVKPQSDDVPMQSIQAKRKLPLGAPDASSGSSEFALKHAGDTSVAQPPAKPGRPDLVVAPAAPLANDGSGPRQDVAVAAAPPGRRTHADGPQSFGHVANMTRVLAGDQVVSTARPVGIATPNVIPGEMGALGSKAGVLLETRNLREQVTAVTADRTESPKMPPTQAVPVIPSGIKSATAEIAQEKLPPSDVSALDTDGLPLGKENSLHVMPRADTIAAQTLAPSFDLSSVRPESIRSAAANVVEVLLRQPGKPVEISLDPKELGRVRIALSTTETGVTVIITAERAETQELMRRYVDQLAQEFQRLGYEHTSLEFASESEDQKDDPGSQGAHLISEHDAPDRSAPERTYRLVSTGLDLRL